MSRTVSWIAAAKVYADRRILTILLLGFSSGLPILLVYSTLSAWMREAGLSLSQIGYLSLFGTAYSLKFLWSPLVDRLPLPVLSRLLGRRRGWMLLSQIAVMAAIFKMSGSDPTTAVGLSWLGVFAVATAFASATQDIVIDAYRVEILDRDQLAAGAGVVVFGYRVGMVAAGAGALLTADLYDWATAYQTMAMLMGVGILTTLLSKEPPVVENDESRALDAEADQFLARRAHLPPRVRTLVLWLYKAVAAPFMQFVRHNGLKQAVIILAFVALYRYTDALLGVMANPFYIDLGYTKSEIAQVSKVFGVLATLIGGLVGGVAVARLGLLPALVVFGVFEAGSNLGYAWLSTVADPTVLHLYGVIGVENLSGGMATAAFVAYLSSLCNVAYTATQYALLTSLTGFARTVLASVGGVLAENLGWTLFFLVTVAAVVPAFLLLLAMLRGLKRDAAAQMSTPSQ